MAAAQDPDIVRRRKVFYIPGYDPFPARRYRELYRTESARQAEISGYQIAMRKGAEDPSTWQVDAEMDGVRTTTEIEVLGWSDIVRASMSDSIPATYWQLLRTVWIYVGSGALRRLTWLRKGPVLAALYPVGMLVLQVVLALMAGRLVAWPVTWLGGSLAGWAVTVPVAILVLKWFKAQDHRLYAYYLMHDYAHTAKARGAYPPELDERMSAFGLKIAAALADDVDEVLVVGHSSGAHLAVSILSGLFRTGRVPANGPALALLTLGEVIPMVSFLPEAKRLRGDLHVLAQREDLTWIDVTAPGDGCSFALCDPVAVTGVSPRTKRWPLVISAAFTQTLSPERWAELRWRFFRLHFQYLCAFDRPKDYDYFQITAGPRTLGARFAGRPPSRSRIDVPASRYTTMAA